MRKSINRIDASQPGIVAALRKLGGTWISCTGDPHFGCDGLVLWRQRIYFVEIKTGDLPPSKKRLTDGEQKMKAIIEAAGFPYVVWESVDDALKTLGIATDKE